MADMDARDGRRPSPLKLVHDEGRAPTRAPTRDAQVERAIALMRAEPEARWTVTRLARRVGLSRPAFARRFHAGTGTSPMRYLCAVRMQRAAALLRETSHGLPQVAEAVGYTSEFAFNRAFKRHHHLPPGSYRRAAMESARPAFRCAA
ncbi:MAG: helix-turn-helix domain-containing protein [Polyangiales bacterium]